MEQTRSELANAIAELAKRILALCQDVTAIPQMPGAAERSQAEAQEIADSGKCLNCGKPYPKDDQIRRGLDSGCYTQIKRLVDRGVHDDEELVAAGVWLSKTKGGRPKATERAGSAIERYAASKRLASGVNPDSETPSDVAKQAIAATPLPTPNNNNTHKPAKNS